jgi:DNA-binding transcriptional LysR family regulator
MNITLRQVQAFLTIAELGSFTRAAERLHVAQPALSQNVRDLEQELGLRLFDRTTRRVELTAGGLEFRDAAAKIVEDFDLAIANARDLAARRRGRLTVAAPPLLAAAILPDVIAEFAVTHPAIRVALVDARTDQIIERVRTGQADCGIGTFPPGDEGVDRVALARDQLMVFCDPRCIFAGRAEVTWADLADHPLIALTRDSGLRLLAEVGYESAGIAMRPAYEVAQITTAVALVEAGLGLSVLPTYARAAARNRNVVTRPLVVPAIAREIVMISQRGRSPVPALAPFAALLRKHARALLLRESA